MQPPLFIEPLKRNGIFIMERITWEMYQQGIGEDGKYSNEVKYSYLLAISALKAEEVFKGNKVWIILKNDEQ